jgi:plastocyanin
MADWSIKIEPVENPGSGSHAVFVPQLQPPSDSGLNVDTGDVVTWNNATAAEHQPWPADSNFQQLPNVKRLDQNYLSDVIPADNSSRPSWIARLPVTTPPTAVPYTFRYVCRLHPDEKGIITIRS